MRLTRRAILAAATLAPSVAHTAQSGGPATAPPSLDELLREPDAIDAAISPSGEQLALLHAQTENDKRVSYVSLTKLSDVTDPPAKVRLGAHQIDFVEWANDERLLIWVTYHKDEKGRAYGLRYGGEFFPIPLRRAISVDLKGENAVALFANTHILRRGFDAATVVDFMRDDPRCVLMQAMNVMVDAPALFKVDVYTGFATLVEQGGPLTMLWMTQNGVPMLRYDRNRRGTMVALYGRAPGTENWKLIRNARLNEEAKLVGFDVVGPTPKAGVFLVAERPEGRDHAVLKSFDIASAQLGEIVAETPGRDVSGAFVDENLKLVGAAYWDDRLGYEIPDPGFATQMRAVNKALGDACNVALHDISLDHSRVLLKASGPKEPGSYYLYDRSRRALEVVGVSRPWLQPGRLAATTPLKVKTRDGTEVTAYLTIPAHGAPGPLPLVVMPHGGPERRDYLDYSTEAQWLAAKGWMVLQANFRGSGGYGKAFAEAGRKQWNGRMQEDLEDVIAYVTSAGRADPQRVAIFGISYGGYTALMQAVRRPELYKAVVAAAADSDLVESLAFTRREDGWDSEAYAYWVASMGDPKQDRQLLQHASPALRAAEIAAPVLLIHGTEDSIVDPKQSKLMAKALQSAGKPYEYVELKGEAHSGWSQDTWKTVLEKTTDFIGKHI